MKASLYKIKSGLFFIVLLVAGCFLSCSRDKDPKSQQSNSNESKIQRVEIKHPAYRSFTAEVLITGTAEPNRKVMLHAMENGYVKTLYKDIGDAVQKGNVIAELDNPELYHRQQRLAAEVKAKKLIYKRLKSTYEKTPAITPLQVLENSQAEYLSLKAQKDAVNDQISFLKVKAPFSGIITQRFVDEGALIQSGITSPNAIALFEIQQIHPIRLSIPLPETDVGAIYVGMQVVINFPELPGESFAARISRTANSLDKASKTMRVEIDIPNVAGKIKPGMYAKVLIQLSSRDSVLSLPVTAQAIFQDQAFLMVVADKKVKLLSLRKGLFNKDYFEVLNTEISPQTQVIVQGKSLVKPGDVVETVLKPNRVR